MILSVCPNPSIDILGVIDRITPGKVNRIREQYPFPGGKGIHVALAIAEITGSSIALGIWGGPTGEWLKKECSKRNVECIGLDIINWTRMCYSFNSQYEEFNETELLGPGPVISEPEFESFIKKYQSISESYDIVCMSGSWPSGVADSAYNNLIKKSEGKKVFLDCSGELLKQAMKSSPYCIHVNRQEGAELFGISDPVEIVWKLYEYCKMAALSHGKNGLYLVCENSLVHANVTIDKEFSCVGSGDCLMAGLAIATDRGYSIEDIAKYGTACGAANCLHDEIGILKSADVQKLFREVEVQIIDR